jgi:hypothetical protein
MILNIQHQANWELIRQRKQRIIEKNNKQENAKRTPHNYRIGDQVLLKEGTENKYESPYSGPHKILQVCDNGTVRLKVKGVTDSYNIRRLAPFIEASKSNYGGECSIRQSQSRRKISGTEN